MSRKGWRAWGLAEDSRGPVLTAPEQGHRYPERESWAECLRDHPAPQPDCSCGLYSADSGDSAVAWLTPGSVAVVGKVRLLGEAFDGSPEAANGLMAMQRSSVAALTGVQLGEEVRSAGVRLAGKQRVHPDHADSVAALAGRYGVPFVMDPELAEHRSTTWHLAQDMQRRLDALARLTAEPEAAGLLLLNRERTHVVLQLRSSFVDYSGTWALVGGAVEPGESPTEAALREAWEEARIEAVDVLREVRRKGYTYVVAEADWTPEQDWVLPGSANLEADGAGWVPLAVLDSPESYPSIALHPKLAQAWPRLRERL